MAKAKNTLGLRLLGDRLLIDLDKPEEVTKSGIILPEGAREETQTGVVVLVGPNVSEEIKVGSRILYNKYGLDEIEYNGKTCYLLTSEEVLVIIE